MIKKNKTHFICQVGLVILICLVLQSTYGFYNGKSLAASKSCWKTDSTNRCYWTVNGKEATDDEHPVHYHVDGASNMTVAPDGHTYVKKGVYYQKQNCIICGAWEVEVVHNHHLTYTKTYDEEHEYLHYTCQNWCDYEKTETYDHYMCNTTKYDEETNMVTYNWFCGHWCGYSTTTVSEHVCGQTEGHPINKVYTCEDNGDGTHTHVVTAECDFCGKTYVCENRSEEHRWEDTGNKVYKDGLSYDILKCEHCGRLWEWNIRECDHWEKYCEVYWKKVNNYTKVKYCSNCGNIAGTECAILETDVWDENGRLVEN